MDISELNLYEKCLSEESDLQFESVNQTEMLKLGLDIYDVSREYSGPVAIQIILNGKLVFAFYPEGTGNFHAGWLRNKANLVEMCEMSTLRAFLELKKIMRSFIRIGI